MNQRAPLFDNRSVAVIILALLVFASYFNSLANPFMWDDKAMILYNPGIQGGWESVLRAFSPSMWGGRADNQGFQSFYRPIQTITTIIDYRIWGLNPFGFHLSNTLFHLIDTILLYFLALRLTGSASASLLAGAIFAVHPVHTESVTFISARNDLLSALFMIPSFYLYLSFGDNRPGKGLRYGLSLFFFLLALLSKEMALTLPLLLTVYALMFERWGGRTARIVPYYFILALYIAFRVLGLSVFTESHSVRADIITLAFTASTAVFDYIRLLFIPYPLKAFYSLIWYGSLSIKVAAAFILFIASAALVVWLFLRDRRMHAFAALWTYITLLPVLNMGALGEFSIAERYLYIPSIGFSIFIAMAATTAGRTDAPKKGIAFAAIIVIAVLGILTFQRNKVWKDDLTFYSTMVDGAPDSVIARVNLGKTHIRQGRLDEASAEYEAAVRLAPGNHNIHYELGGLYLKSGKAAQAITHLESAVELKPDFKEAYNAIGIAYAELGELNAAETAFEKALSLDPGSEAAKANLQKLRERRKRLK